jgi:hypothetical protein
MRTGSLGILADIMEQLGFKFYRDIREVEIGDEMKEIEVLVVTVTAGDITTEIFLYNDESPQMNCCYGRAPPNTNFVKINFKKFKEKNATVGDLAATVCHEICHRVLEITHGDKLPDREEEIIILGAHVDVIDIKNGPFSKQYVEDQKWNLNEYSSEPNPPERACLGSVFLSIFVFLGLILTRTFKDNNI